MAKKPAYKPLGPWEAEWIEGRRQLLKLQHVPNPFDPALGRCGRYIPNPEIWRRHPALADAADYTDPCVECRAAMMDEVAWLEAQLRLRGRA